MTINVSTAMPTSFKVELLKGVHDFSAGTGDVFKVALLKASKAATGVFGASTTNYSELGDAELPTGGGYTAGGATLSNITPTASGATAVTSFASVIWTPATFTTCGAVIYNVTAGSAVCAVLSFSGDRQVSAGDFELTFPAAAFDTAIIRIS